MSVLVQSKSSDAVTVSTSASTWQALSTAPGAILRSDAGPLSSHTCQLWGRSPSLLFSEQNQSFMNVVSRLLDRFLHASRLTFHWDQYSIHLSIYRSVYLSTVSVCLSNPYLLKVVSMQCMFCRNRPKKEACHISKRINSNWHVITC